MVGTTGFAANHAIMQSCIHAIMQLCFQFQLTSFSQLPIFPASKELTIGPKLD
jgi:hypothetical protein